MGSSPTLPHENRALARRFSEQRSFSPRWTPQNRPYVEKSKARPTPAEFEYDPAKHMPRTTAAITTLRTSKTPGPKVHDVGDEAMPVVKFNAVYHWVGPDGMLRHGVVIGQNASHALLATREGRFTAPKVKLSPGIHPDAHGGKQ